MEKDFTPQTHLEATYNFKFLIQLNKANGILSKTRHFIDRKTLKLIYHAIFEPHLYYSSLVWTQNSNSIKRLFCKRNPYRYVFPKS